MDRPSIDASGAMIQAGHTAAVYLSSAIESIDKYLGDGYAGKHPELVAPMVAAQVSDFNTVSTMDAIYELADAVRDHGDSQRAALDRITTGLGDIEVNVGSLGGIEKALGNIATTIKQANP
jgi:hypothetical protein